MVIDWPVRTERLTLRAYTPDDLDALWAYERLPQVQQWLGWVPHSRAELAEAMERESSDTTHVMVILGAAIIGHIMVIPRDGWAQTDVAAHAKGLEAELGWIFDPAYGRHGYATEAVRAVIGLCFDTLKVRRIQAGCFADNTASWRLMERLGFRLEEHSRSTALHRDGTWHDGRTYALLREEWPTAETTGTATGDSAQPWTRLAPDYERARDKDDSLDRLVEWPAQRELLGDVTGRSVLDLGCGNGGKLAELIRAGARHCVGVDISGNFITPRPDGLELVPGDISELNSIPALAGRRFDRIMFLQSFGYASDPVRTLRAARAMLADDGFILLTRTQPIRYARERAEQNGTSLGQEYFSKETYSYRHRWNDQITLTKRPYTMSDLLNVFSAAGLWIETTVEPQLSENARSRYPHKHAWMNKYLGILIFKLRPLPGN